jgi:hypothetical protein
VRQTQLSQGVKIRRNQTEYESGKCSVLEQETACLVQGFGSTGGSEISDVPVDNRAGCRHPDIAAKSKTLFSKSIRQCKGKFIDFLAIF